MLHSRVLGGSAGVAGYRRIVQGPDAVACDAGVSLSPEISDPPWPAVPSALAASASQLAAADSVPYGAGKQASTCRRSAFTWASAQAALRPNSSCRILATARADARAA